MRLAHSMCLVLTLFAGAARGEEPGNGSRLRCLDRNTARLLARVTSWSPSARTLVDRVERSDLIVHLRMDGLITRHKGETRLVIAAPGARYVMVSLNPRANERELLASLGHELQHVAEIAGAPEARDTATVEALYRRIGWPVSGADDFETGAAIEMGRRVAHELRGVRVDPRG